MDGHSYNEQYKAEICQHNHFCNGNTYTSETWAIKRTDEKRVNALRNKNKQRNDPDLVDATQN